MATHGCLHLPGLHQLSWPAPPGRSAQALLGVVHVSMPGQPSGVVFADFVRDGRLKEEDLDSVVFASRPASGGAILHLAS